MQYTITVRYCMEHAHLMVDLAHGVGRVACAVVGRLQWSAAHAAVAADQPTGTTESDSHHGLCSCSAVPTRNASRQSHAGMGCLASSSDEAAI